MSWIAASGRSARVAHVHAGDEVAERGDRRIGPALGEVEAGEGAHVGRTGRGIPRGRRRGAGGELGAGRLGAADLEQELGEGEGGAGIGRFPGRSPGGIGRSAEHRLGLVGLAVAEVPLHERRPGARVLREAAVHRRELVADGGVVARLLEEGEAREVQPLVPGRGGEAGLDLGKRAGGVLRLQAVGDEDEAGHDVAGVVGEDARRHRDRPRLASLRSRAAAEVDGRLQRPVAGIGGVELPGARRVHGGGVEVPDLEGELGERGMGLGEVGPDVDELLVLGEGVAGRALVAEEAGVAQPGLGMVGVQAEDVAELDRRPLLVAGLEIGEGALVMGLGTLGLAVAAGEGDGEKQGAEEGDTHWGRTPDFARLRAGAGSGRRAAARAPGGGRAAARGKRRPPARA